MEMRSFYLRSMFLLLLTVKLNDFIGYYQQSAGGFRPSSARYFGEGFSEIMVGLEAFEFQAIVCPRHSKLTFYFLPII